MRSKKGIVDVYVIIFVGIMMFFFWLTMSFLVSRLDTGAEIEDHQSSTSVHMLSRFLNTPTDHLIEDHPGITMAEYVTMEMDGNTALEFDQGFEDYFSDFKTKLCAGIGASEICAIRIKKEDCSPRRNCEYPDGYVGGDDVVGIEFYDAEGDEYVIELKTDSNIPEIGVGGWG